MGLIKTLIAVLLAAQTHAVLGRRWRWKRDDAVKGPSSQSLSGPVKKKPFFRRRRPFNDNVVPSKDTPDTPSEDASSFVSLLKSHGLRDVDIENVKTKLKNDGVDLDSVLATLRNVPYNAADYPNTTECLESLPKVAQKLFQGAVSTIANKGSTIKTGDASAPDLGGPDLSGVAKSAAAAQEAAHLLRGVQESLQPFMDDATREREQVAGENTEQREKLWKEVQITLEKIPKLPPLDDYDFKGALSALEEHARSSLNFDVNKLTSDEVDKLLHYNKLMQGLVLNSADVPRKANGCIGVLRPGRNPFHWPSGETHVFEMRDIEATQQYSHMASVRASAGSSWSSTVSTKTAAVAWYGMAAGAIGADTHLSSGQASEKKVKMTYSQQSKSQLKVLTQESHANMMQFLLADADYDLSPEFEAALNKCQEAYSKRHKFAGSGGSGGSVGAYTYDDDAFKSLFREFGTHFATSATLGGSYYKDATISSTVSAGKSDHQSALRYAMASSTSGAVSVTAVTPVGAGSGKVAAAEDEKAEHAKQSYDTNAQKLAQSSVSMHIQVTGGKYGSVEEWRDEVNTNHLSWRVIDREFSHRLLPVWSLVQKSGIQDKKMVSELMKHTWERMALYGEEQSTRQKVEPPLVHKDEPVSALQTGHTLTEASKLESPSKKYFATLSYGQLFVYKVIPDTTLGITTGSKQPLEIWASGSKEAVNLKVEKTRFLLNSPDDEEVWSSGRTLDADSLELTLTDEGQLRLVDRQGNKVVWKSRNDAFAGQGYRTKLYVDESMDALETEQIVSENGQFVARMKEGNFVVYPGGNENGVPTFETKTGKQNAKELSFDLNGNLRITGVRGETLWQTYLPPFLGDTPGVRVHLRVSNAGKLQIFNMDKELWTSGSTERMPFTSHIIWNAAWDDRKYVTFDDLNCEWQDVWGGGTRGWQHTIACIKPEAEAKHAWTFDPVTDQDILNKIKNKGLKTEYAYHIRREGRNWWISSDTRKHDTRGHYLHFHDKKPDKSGRQAWIIIPVEGESNTYNIQVAGGTPDGLGDDRQFVGGYNFKKKKKPYGDPNCDRDQLGLILSTVEPKNDWKQFRFEPVS